MEALFIITIDSRTLYTLSVGLQGMKVLIRASTGLCSHRAHSCLHPLAFPPFLGHQPVREHLLRARGECRAMLLGSNKVSMSLCACLSGLCEWAQSGGCVSAVMSPRVCVSVPECVHVSLHLLGLP